MKRITALFLIMIFTFSSCGGEESRIEELESQVSALQEQVASAIEPSYDYLSDPNLNEVEKAYYALENNTSLTPEEKEKLLYPLLWGVEYEKPFVFEYDETTSTHTVIMPKAAIAAIADLMWFDMFFEAFETDYASKFFSDEIFILNIVNEEGEVLASNSANIDKEDWRKLEVFYIIPA